MPDPTVTKFVEWGFMGLVGGSLSFAVLFLQRISGSINRLNVQVGALLERTMGLSKSVDNHETRISHLERRHK